MTESLFERLGGPPAINATVVKLYDKVLADDLLAPFFDNVDMETLRKSQVAFVTMAFGGPHHYTGQGLRHSHAKLVTQGLSDKHFDAIVHHLKAAMEELSVPLELIREALAIVESTRHDVLAG